MQPAGNFHAAYQELQKKMRSLAVAEGDIYLPNPEPDGPVQYILICMEPSLGRWARSAQEARSKVEMGFRNFLPSDETSILHFCNRRYLCGPGERYYITDFSKGAMLVDQAGLARAQRYEKWFELLKEEIDLVATPGAGIVAVGKVVAQHLRRQGFGRQFTQVIHYSGQAARARIEGIAGREASFEAFKDSVTDEDLLATAREVLASARVPDKISNETLSLLKRFRLTASRKQLIFNYKLAFEAIRASQVRSPAEL